MVEVSGVVSVRSCQKFCPCLVEPMTDRSRIGPPLAMAEPIRNGGNTSVIIDLRSKKPVIMQM